VDDDRKVLQHTGAPPVIKTQDLKMIRMRRCTKAISKPFEDCMQIYPSGSDPILSLPPLPTLSREVRLDISRLERTSGICKTQP